MSKIFKSLAVAVALWAGGHGLQDVQAQELGGLARFEGGQVRDAKAGVTFDLDLSQGVPWRVYTLSAPNRLVLDFREVDWQAADPEVFDQADGIDSVRMGSFRAGWSRLVALLNAPMTLREAGLTIDPETARAALRVQLARASQVEFDAVAGAPRDPRWDLPPAAAVRSMPKGDGPLLVVIDPGHGGIDPGAETESLSEADLMLTFARELREVLLRSGGFEVALTRDADVFVSLEGRVKLAHELGADIFVSLHADALEEGAARGAAIYTLADEASDAASAALAERHDRDDLLAGLDLSGSDDRVANVLMSLARLDNSPRSHAMARHLLAGIRNAVGRVHKHPLRQAGFSVLKAADIPSVLIELGFLSTSADLRNLRDPAWRAGMAAGIRDGLQAWAVEDAALARLRRQ
ncbi:N-acetylmuramoyl-L-alanine amidase [Puniceibacterium sp. IMCC21224]|uniref:N-acetylmuramoyl-L-alanine amidase n=1 Tax=Puniceibacterium sp. IMCC21224 TaxID=1618204 RepID=UPI00065D98CF|nr:N-acetylmuramoyl-L-alanine amidase [Puniceibacterium sp. IMCC21224]KMK67513.1 N-acetylmuramoyl-L-alanine amidase [Puniceibacterium sp. IMCC21224]